MSALQIVVYWLLMSETGAYKTGDAAGRLERQRRGQTRAGQLLK